MAAALPYIYGLTAVAGVASTITASKDAGAAREQQSRLAEVEAQSRRLQMVREARIRRAQIEASGAAQGLGADTSGIVGATSSIASQVGYGQGQQNIVSGITDRMNMYNQKSADAAFAAQGWQAIGGLTERFGGPDMFKDLWGKTTVNQTASNIKAMGT